MGTALALLSMPAYFAYRAHVAARDEQRRERAADLIRFINREEKFPGVIECVHDLAEARESRAAARELVQLGAPALPEIERVMESLETDAYHSPYYRSAIWSFLAYAHLTGAKALPRFRAMMGKPQFAQFQEMLGPAAAASLNITSYVDRFFSSRGGNLSSCVSAEPWEGLERLILGWEQEDREFMETGLGPIAKNSLDELLQQQSWDEFMHGLRPRRQWGRAMGFRVESNELWNQPQMTLDPRADGGRAVTMALVEAQHDIDATLVDASGERCGRVQVRFSIHSHFVVDSPDIRALLASISACLDRVPAFPAPPAR
jgi:hypothetical protein